MEEIQIELENVNSIKDLEVSFDSHLNFDQHVHKKINKAYGNLGIIKRNFRDLSTPTFVTLYKTLVRPHLNMSMLYGDLVTLRLWRNVRKFR